MKTLTVATVQYRSASPDLQRNTEVGLQIVREAKMRGADIVLFPECWLTTYAFPEIAESRLPQTEIENHPDFRAWYDAALDENSAPIKAFQDVAKELSIGIVLTGFTKGITRPQNSAYVIDRNGEILLKYSKVHTCDFDRERMLESGSEFKVCDFDGVKIGIMICYDREYPESARVLMMKGAEIILVPNDCGTMKHRLQVLSTRAYENMVGVVMANPPGENAGCSCAFGPAVWDRNGRSIDNTIMVADEMTEEIFIAKYDVEELRSYRNQEMMGNTFRKVQAYRELLNDEVEQPFIRTVIS